MKRYSYHAGVSLIEVMVGISIVAVIVGVVGFSVSAYVDARTALLQSAKAIYLAEEGYEIIRALRDDNWNTLAVLPTDTTQYLAVATTTLAVSGTPEVIDGSYTRSFVFRDAYRNGSDDLTSSTTPGASIDPDARILEMSVLGPTGTTTLEAVVTNLHAL